MKFLSWGKQQSHVNRFFSVVIGVAYLLFPVSATADQPKPKTLTLQGEASYYEYEPPPKEQPPEPTPANEPPDSDFETFLARHPGLYPLKPKSELQAARKVALMARKRLVKDGDDNNASTGGDSESQYFRLTNTGAVKLVGRRAWIFRNHHTPNPLDD